MDTKASTYVSAAGILEKKLSGLHFKFQGYVHDPASIQTRTVQMQGSSKRKASGDKSVVDCVLFDRTGAVGMSLWEAAADDFMRIVNAHPAEKLLIIELEHFSVQSLVKSEWNGTSLTTINVIRSVASTDSRVMTQVRVCTAPNSPYNENTLRFIVPQSPVALHQFQNLKAQALPFRGTFVGTLSDVGEEEYTTNGQPKRAFHLIDDFGYWFPCCAIGRNATEWRFTPNTKVVIYFGTARLQNQEASFILYIFRDGLIVPISQSPNAPAKRMDVSTRP